MNTYNFVVFFTNQTHQPVVAFSKAQAIILAQARQIQAGLGYDVAFVEVEGERI